MIQLIHQSKNIEYVYLMLFGATEYLSNVENNVGDQIEIKRKNGKNVITKIDLGES